MFFLLDVYVFFKNYYKQTISVFPVLGMIQTGQRSVQCRAQASPGWFSDNFHPDGLDLINYNFIATTEFLCCAGRT